MKKTTFGFTVETDKDSIHIIGDERNNQVVIVTPHEVDNLVSMLQEAKSELLGKKKAPKKPKKK